MAEAFEFCRLTIISLAACVTKALNKSTWLHYYTNIYTATADDVLQSNSNFRTLEIKKFKTIKISLNLNSYLIQEF